MRDRPLILVADDDADVRAFLKATLERNGFDTVSAANGREALDRLGEEAVDVLLLDVGMPVLDGVATLRQIRASDPTRTLPVILITGSGAEADRVLGLELGADDYLAKPIAVKELVARVRAQVRSRDAWTHVLERGRVGRRRLAAALEGVRTDLPLMTLAAQLADRLPAALDVDGVAILHFDRDGVRSITSGGALERRFPPTRMVAHRIGTDLARRAASGPWLEAASSGTSSRSSPHT